MPLIAELFEFECLVFDKVSWSDIAAAHNRLVVGSSPTSSTTQSRVTGEFPEGSKGPTKAVVRAAHSPEINIP